MSSMTRHLTAVIAAALLMLAGSTAQAAQDDAEIDPLPADVEVTPELKEHLATLSTAEQEDFVRTQLPASSDTVVGPQQPADAEAQASAAAAEARGAEAAPEDAGCWTQRVDGWSEARAGNTLYTYYHVGSWCSDGSSVTEASVADNGGETSTPGWRYEGVTDSDAGVVNNEGRSYSQYKFVLGAGGWDIQTPTPCIRVIGQASGEADSDLVCGIY